MTTMEQEAYTISKSTAHTTRQEARNISVNATVDAMCGAKVEVQVIQSINQEKLL
jgi:hypothetical protein